MLYVKTPEEVLALIESEFSPLEQAEFVALSEAVGRVLAEDIAAREYVPDFDRSTVDGFAVRASDTFGCNDAIPAILPLQATVLMGEGADYLLNEGECVAVPTGGAVPRGTDGGDGGIHGGLRRRHHRCCQTCGAGHESDFPGG